MGVVKYSFTSDEVVDYLKNEAINYVRKHSQYRKDDRIFEHTYSFYVEKHNNYSAHGGISLDEIEIKLNHVFLELENEGTVAGFRLLINYDFEKDFWNYSGCMKEKSYRTNDVCIVYYDDEKNSITKDTVPVSWFLNSHVFITVKLEFGI